MMTPPATAEHKWLQQLIGDWTSIFQCPTEPGKPPVTFGGTDRVRAIGDYWIQAEGLGVGPDDKPSISMLTLGYDADKGRFVGSWFGSMMTYFWTYEGTLAGNALTLDTVGPDCFASGQMRKYKEVITLVEPGVRTFSSSMLKDDGSWSQIMTGTFRRA